MPPVTAPARARRAGNRSAPALLAAALFAGAALTSPPAQHHRFWAHQNDASLPHPPAGSFAGGPNSGIQDPVAQARLAGCKPATCYLDDIGSYSTNEVAINWNAPLAWLAAYAAERHGPPAQPAPRILVSPGTVSVPEGGSVPVRVRLSAAPTGNVAVTVARASGDPDLTVVTGSAPIFTPANWSTEQTVTVAAAQDADTTGGTAVFTLTGPGAGSAALTATEADDDRPATGSCRVAYHVDSTWAGGFTATVTLTNTGPTALQGWSLGWSFPADQRITNAWNAAVTQSGAGVTAEDLGWNGALAAGGTASFGFQADRTGADNAPARFTLNGAVCA